MKIKFMSFFVSLIILLECINVTAVWADYSPTLDDYVIYGSGSTQLSRLDAGDSCRLEVTLSDSGVKTSDIIKKENINVQSVSGCFGSASLTKTEILSSTDESLMYKLTFDKATYTGTGKYMSFKVNYKNLGYTSSLLKLKITECSEVSGTDDVTTETDSDGNKTVTISQPVVEILRGDVSPVKAGETFTVNLTVKNHGATDLLKPVVSISTSGDISIAENTSSLYIADIKAGATTHIPLKFQAEDKISRSTEEFTVEVKYNYNSGTNGISTNSETAVISVPTVVTQTESAPAVQITRDKINAVEADTSFVLPITVKNVGGSTMLTPILSISTGDEIASTDGNITFTLDDIKPNNSQTVNVNLKTAKLVTTDYQNLDCELKYTYKDDNTITSGSETTKINIPVVSNTKDGVAPLVQITRSNIENPINANTGFSFTISVKNEGNVAIKNSVLNIEGSDEVIVTNNSVNIGTLNPSESKTATIKCRTMKELTSASQAINAELKYSYLSGKSYQQGNDSVKIIVPVVKTKEDDDKDKTKAAVPNIIVDNFSYGSESIATGKKFNLNLNFKNTSKSTAVSNVVVTFEPDGNLAISSAANTYYYDSLGALQTQGQMLEMQALPTAEAGSAKVTVTFKYEYMDGKERNEATTTQSVSIPVYKPDRMMFTPKSTDAPGVVGEEYTISIDYLNKGKGEISNVRAELLGDIESTQTVQNLGNFEAGKSGTINFIVTPTEEGETPVSIKVTYEDANMEEKERVFNFNIKAEASQDDYDLYDGLDETEDEDAGTPIKKIIGFAAAGVVALLAIIIAVVKIKKRKAKKDSIKVDWED